MGWARDPHRSGQIDCIGYQLTNPAHAQRAQEVAVFVTSNRKWSFDERATRANLKTAMDRQVVLDRSIIHDIQVSRS
jgi:hypothetical protein